jgi:transcriptional regulator with GAF, ATPase, and Fis domain
VFLRVDLGGLSPQLFESELWEPIDVRVISRREDIPLFLERFIAIYAQKYNFPVKRRSVAALDRLMTYHWPDNVRSLRHTVGSGVGLIRHPAAARPFGCDSNGRTRQIEFDPGS